VRGKPLSLTGDRLIPGRQAAERAEGLLAVLGELGDTSFRGAGPVIREADGECCLDVGAGGIAAPQHLVGAQRGQVFGRDRHEGHLGNNRRTVTSGGP